MVKEYDFSKEDKQLSEHFMLHEAKSPDSDLVLVSEELVSKVEQLRAAVPNCNSIELSSGYRTPEHSVAVGGGASDFHTKGMAWDLACFDADHNIIDGKVVACIAQDLGFNGIGYMGNWIHVDIGNRHWWGDETANCNVADFYDYFGIARAEQVQGVVQAVQSEEVSSSDVDITYQVYADGRWLPDVKNLEDFAGIKGAPIQGIYISAASGSVIYRAHTKEDGWLPEVTDRNDFAGILGHIIDAIEIRLSGLDEYDVLYKVSPLSEEYLPEVKNTEDYAGVFGKAIDAVQIHIVHK